MTAAEATTLGEPVVSADFYSTNWFRPEPVAMGLANVTQVMAVSPRQGLTIPVVTAGGRQLTLSVSALLGTDVAYAAGGPTLCSTSPFLWHWEHDVHATFFRGFWRPNPHLAFVLRVASTGTVSLTLDFTNHGRDSRALLPTVRLLPVVATTVAPAVVPLPFPGLALASGLGMMMLLKRRRRQT